MQTTQEFIAVRSKAILNEIKALRSELAALRSLKASLAVAKSGKSIAERGKKDDAGLTFQDMIIKVLSCQPNSSAEAYRILELIEQEFGKKIQRSSISPQLSRLKSRDVLQLNGNIWSLTESFKFEHGDGGANTIDEDESGVEPDDSWEDDIPS